MSINTARLHIPRLVRRADARATVHGNHAVGRFNAWHAAKITRAVGSMWCAYAFALLALVSLPAALQSGNKVVVVS